MTILVIDPESTYHVYWQQQGADAVSALGAALFLINNSPSKYDKIIVSSRLLSCVPELVRLGQRVEAATATPTVAEAVAAYRVGASDYYIKDFRC